MEKKKKNLKNFYMSLPESTHPKIEFLRRIMDATGVTEATARNWVLYGKKPTNKKFIQTLTELTGMDEKELWAV